MLEANRLYAGVVRDNNDPLKRSRVKVAIFGYTDNLNVKDLPWYVLITSASAPNNQSLSVMKPSTTVLVSFPDEDIYNGIVLYAISNCRSE